MVNIALPGVVKLSESAVEHRSSSDQMNWLDTFLTADGNPEEGCIVLPWDVRAPRRGVRTRFEGISLAGGKYPSPLRGGGDNQ